MRGLPATLSHLRLCPGSANECRTTAAQLANDIGSWFHSACLNQYRRGISSTLAIIFTDCMVLPLRDLLVRATLILLLFAFIYRASWDVIPIRIRIFRIAWSLISLALLDYYTMHFGWNFELLYCRWLFCFSFFSCIVSIHFIWLYLDIPYPIRSTHVPFWMWYHLHATAWAGARVTGMSVMYGVRSTSIQYHRTYRHGHQNRD